MFFLSRAGAAKFVLGGVSGGGEGGRGKEGHRDLGMELLSHYTTSAKGCHTKWTSSCAFVFAGILHTVRA